MRGRAALVRLAVLVVLVVLAGACTCRGKSGGAPAPGPRADPGPPKRGGVLLMGTTWLPAMLDPVVNGGANANIWTSLLLYDQLVRVQEDGLGAEPGLAESWDVSPDGLVYTFHLRPGLTFSDGEPLRASDVKFSLLRAATDPKSIGATLYPSFEIQTPDDRTVALKLKAPWPPALATLALFTSSVLPEAYFNRVGGEKFNQAPIGSGPFVLAELRNGQHAILKRNPRHWDPERPYLDEVRLIPIWDDMTRMLKLQAGEIDVAESVPFNQVEFLRGMSNVTVHMAPIMVSDFLLLNPRAKVFQDIKIRQAIHWAIDRAALVKLAYFGNAEVASSFFPRMLYSDPVPYHQVLQKARQLLAEGNHPEGLSAEMMIFPGMGIDEQVATVLQSQLAPLGIHLDIQRIDGPTRWNRVERGDYDAILYLGGTSDTFDPAPLVDAWAVSTQANPRRWGYRNAAVDELATKAKVEMDPIKRAEMYLAIQHLVRDDAVMIALTRPHKLTAVRDNVHGFAVPPTANYLLQDTWKSP